MTAAELKARVVDEIDRYLEEYVEPASGTTFGVPWSKDRIQTEVDQMKSCLIEPFISEYLDNDTHSQDSSKSAVRRSCWVVAVDDSYGLIFDSVLGDFALVSRSSTSAADWASFGIRGDVVSTFLAR